MAPFLTAKTLFLGCRGGPLFDCHLQKSFDTEIRIGHTGPCLQRVLRRGTEPRGRNRSMVIECSPFLPTRNASTGAMSTHDDHDTAELVRRAGAGDEDASRRLLVRSRARLRRMVAVRLDQRVLARVDPSDVVQEVLLDASRRLIDYSQHPRIPFYAWLHRLAKDRLATVHQRHIQTQKRSVNREHNFLTDRSTDRLADRLLDPRSGPRQQFLRKET